MSVKDEDGFRAWQRLNQRFEPGLAARQGIVMAEFSGMVAQPAKCIVDRDGPQDEVGGGRDREEVSEMHARSVLVWILDPVTRHHRHEPFEVI